MSKQLQQSVADAARDNWVDRWAPDWLKPYARLSRFDRPIGWWLLLLPCWWSSALAAIADNRPLPNVWHIVLFLIGAIAMRGAGCTYNDIVDRDYDGRVARTALRPIPSGQVTVNQARAYMFAQCLVGLVVLLQFNWFAVGVGVSSLLIVAVYPFMKRFSDWPQSVLGLAFSWGALMGWAGHFGSLGLAPVLLYMGGIAWTIGYDTIYAHQDKEDDALIGVRSTARLFGENTKPWLTGLYGLATILFAASLFLAGAGWLSYLGLAIGLLHMANQIRRLNIDDPDLCLELFRSNRTYGLILFAAMVADALMLSRSFV